MQSLVLVHTFSQGTFVRMLGILYLFLLMPPSPFLMEVAIDFLISNQILSIECNLLARELHPGPHHTSYSNFMRINMVNGHNNLITFPDLSSLSCWPLVEVLETDKLPIIQEWKTIKLPIQPRYLIYYKNALSQITPPHHHPHPDYPQLPISPTFYGEI